MVDWPPFSTDEFLQALADHYFPGARAMVVECEGQRFRTLVTPGGKAVSGFYPFPFYLEPLREHAPPAEKKVPHLREVVVATTGVDEPGPTWAVPSPFVDFSRFASWAELRASATPRPGVNSPRRVEEKMRRMERDLGPLELTTDDRVDEDFEQLLDWKAEQYARSWRSHRMTIPRNLDFYRELRRRRLFTVTVLRAGGRLAAGKIGMRIDGRSLWRVTVYNPDLAFYSPGSMIELLSLKALLEAGDRDFDYLMGAERYKFTYATGIRWVGHIGREPRLDRWRRLGRMRLARVATRSPGLYQRLKVLEGRATALRHRLGRG